ncbi:MAG: hypothetical protein ACFB4J_08255 [Elainellaceae cyanobacterium]
MTQQPQPQLKIAPYRYPIQRKSPYAVVPWRTLTGAIASIFFLCAPAPVNAQTTAQSVIDGLPPPPSIPDLDPASATPEDPTAAPVNSTPTNSTPIEVAPADASVRYRVLVNGDSPFLLEQVRRIEPAAAFETHQGKAVILAGQFSQLAPAQRQVEALADQGIGAAISIAPEASSETGSEIEPAVAASDASSASAADNPDEFARPGSSIGSGSVALPPADLSPLAAPQPAITDPAVTAPVAPAPAVTESATPDVTPSPPTQPSASPSPVAQQPAPAGSDFYIVVPGDADDLNRLQGQIALLGAPPNAIAQRERPLGPHLLIGPFVSRRSAIQWNQFLRDFGMDARVYYRR